MAFVNQDAEFRDRERQRTVGSAAPEVLPRREKRHDDLLPFPFPADGKMMLVNLSGFVSEPDRHGGGIGLHPEYEPVRFGKVEAPEGRDIAAALREIAVQPESAAVFFKLACRPRKFRAAAETPLGRSCGDAALPGRETGEGHQTGGRQDGKPCEDVLKA